MTNSTSTFWRAWLITGFLCLVMTMLTPLPLVLFVIGSITALLYHRTDIGLYILIGLAPMLGLVFRGSWFMQITGSTLIPATFFVPLVDLWALWLLIVVGIRMAVQWFDGTPQTVIMPGVWLYGLFLCSAVLSLVHVPSMEVAGAIKYLIRFPLFVYMAYIVMGLHVLSTKQILLQAMKVWVWVAVLAAAQGAASLLLSLSDITGLYRAVPIPMFGIDLFNFDGDIRYGHILLAEHLTVAIPVALYLALSHTRETGRMFFTYISIFLISVCVCTFSRAGWLTLAVQGVLFLVLFRDRIPWHRATSYVPMLVLLLALPTLYMWSTFSSSVVSSSNIARITMTEIGIFHFLEHPLFGNGIGQFVPILADTAFFTYHFGDPVDAHSILTKISTEQGIAGLVTFFVFLGWILREIYGRMRAEQFSFEARAAAYLSLFLVITPLFFQLFNTQYYAARMWVPLLFAIALIFLYRNDKSRTSMYISFLPRPRYRVVSTLEHQDQ